MKEGQRYFKVTMFFPLLDNEGYPFDDDTWGWWRDELTRCHSAFTDLGVVAGWWESHSDLNRWIVAVVGTEKEVDELRRFVQVARQRFRQECMYFEWHEVSFELVK
jgi:hypothetical protein